MGGETQQEKAFGDHLDRLMSSNIKEGDSIGNRYNEDDDEALKLITQAREAAQLESKYGNLEEARLKGLISRHHELKKDIQNLSSTRPQKPTSQTSQKGDRMTGLGPPPAAIDLDELRFGGGGDDENPENWCCICNDDAKWTCLGCDNDKYCDQCFRESHVGPDADWEMKKHRPSPFAKASGNPI
ncbi:hypothetical protein BCR41DRAFT_369035 [Lobosporangium transversale]|uniref:Uncharacterized protein n=1 Tax=Lobosporangium transversale TaxID=64571 RepID=A0A1Y2GT63_9FUNG|nr:hypothetical protein BCR41DRAFT_369035 [Lobosporangium transversale]ORZ22681.1 hypothetical protein BCR41DRAFT_369035 [Lobosporangium transversale]|eukprot:XP_021883235.1 hypothetical protein BCR41DRAFT_369035 [Lobosporangium transversale]